jgi:hypothetical protein
MNELRIYVIGYLVACVDAVFPIPSFTEILGVGIPLSNITRRVK